MNSLDEGRKFTDDVYASKEQIQAFYNKEDITGTWNNVLRYRNLFSFQTPLKDTHNNTYRLCLTKKLLADSYTLQMNLMEDLCSYYQLDPISRNEILLERKCNALLAVLRFSGSDGADEDSIKKLALQQLESIPANLFVADAYSKAYNEDFFKNGVSPKGIDAINRLVIGQYDDEEVNYRKDIIEDLRNPLILTPSPSIKEELNNLLKFLKEETVPIILKALTILYVFSYLKPYHYFSEGTASLFSKNYLSHSGLKTMGFLLDMESIAFSRSTNFFNIAKKTESSLDLTYFMNSILPFLVHDESNLRSKIENARLKNVESISNEAVSVSENQPQVFQQDSKYALPIFPQAAPIDSIEETAKKLLEVYPQLKRKEAHFYAGHCTVGLKYTIEQFRQEEQTVYETARTSMDDLANRGFYKKEKLKNKFVYSPIPLKEEK